MPCIDSSGQMTEMAGKILAAMGDGAPLTEVAEKTGLPLYRIRSGARELVQAGLAEARNETYVPTEAGRAAMRRNIDAWWPEIEAGVEAIVMTASGCGSQVKDYGYLLHDDPNYADKAARISSLTRDLGEVLAAEDLTRLAPAKKRRIAFHSPCSLQHGQRLSGVIADILTRLGHELPPVAVPKTPF